jgi:D-serine deaminase-like pyridoxal phosphate-dependent protein
MAARRGQQLTGWEEPRQAADKAERTRDLLARHGIDCPTVGYRGRHRRLRVRGDERVYTELQCGSYIFMDVDYGRNFDRDGEPTATYERASDEHGRLDVSAATNRLGLGDKIRLIHGHCDPTVNTHPSVPRERGTDREGALVCLRPRQPCRAGLADHRPRCGVLTGTTAS